MVFQIAETMNLSVYVVSINCSVMVAIAAFMCAAFVIYIYRPTATEYKLQRSLSVSPISSGDESERQTPTEAIVAYQSSSTDSSWRDEDGPSGTNSTTHVEQEPEETDSQMSDETDSDVFESRRRPVIPQRRLSRRRCVVNFESGSRVTESDVCRCGRKLANRRRGARGRHCVTRKVCQPRKLRIDVSVTPGTLDKTETLEVNSEESVNHDRTVSDLATESVDLAGQSSLRCELSDPLKLKPKLTSSCSCNIPHEASVVSETITQDPQKDEPAISTDSSNSFNLLGTSCRSVSWPLEPPKLLAFWPAKELVGEASRVNLTNAGHSGVSTEERVTDRCCCVTDTVSLNARPDEAPFDFVSSLTGPPKEFALGLGKINRDGLDTLTSLIMPSNRPDVAPFDFVSNLTSSPKEFTLALGKINRDGSDTMTPLIMPTSANSHQAQTAPNVIVSSEAESVSPFNQVDPEVSKHQSSRNTFTSLQSHSFTLSASPKTPTYCDENQVIRFPLDARPKTATPLHKNEQTTVTLGANPRLHERQGELPPNRAPPQDALLHQQDHLPNLPPVPWLPDGHLYSPIKSQPALNAPFDQGDQQGHRTHVSTTPEFPFHQHILPSTPGIAFSSQLPPTDSTSIPGLTATLSHLPLLPVELIHTQCNNLYHINK